MAKFPVESDDNVGVIDALNYLLSGPQGLGQNFAGFSSYSLAYLTGNYRKPFTQTDPAYIYVQKIDCSSAIQLDGRTFQYNFATTQPSPPFALGNQLTGYNWTNGFYNDDQGVIGAVECTNDYVIFRTNGTYEGVGDDFTGGKVGMNLSGKAISTDCEARITVTGGTDRVFVSGQLDQQPYYNVLGGATNLVVSVNINRYIGQLNNDPTNPDYFFTFDGTVASKEYLFAGLTGSGSLPLIETVFSSIFDEPAPGLYRYILEVRFDGVGVIVSQDDLYLRSLSAQVVKQ